MKYIVTVNPPYKRRYYGKSVYQKVEQIRRKRDVGLDYERWLEYLAAINVRFECPYEEENVVLHWGNKSYIVL